jgi:hypothetical protein
MTAKREGHYRGYRMQPWNPAEATRSINSISREPQLSLSYTKHARERLSERGLVVSDVLYVLRHGFVYEDAEHATVAGLYKYKIESRSPNSGARTLRVVAIPDGKSLQIKIVTVMWRDEV